MKIFLIVVLLPFFLYGERITLYGILKEKYRAPLLRFYNEDYGYIDCPIFGVNTPDNVIKTNCEIEPRKFKKMAFYSKLYMQRTLYLEQKYRIDIADNQCILYNGGKIYNSQLISSGNGFVTHLRPTPIEFERFKDRLIREEGRARKNSKGLWHEWEKEMMCLKNEARL